MAGLGWASTPSPHRRVSCATILRLRGRCKRFSAGLKKNLTEKNLDEKITAARWLAILGANWFAKLYSARFAMDSLRRPTAPAFAPTGRGKQGMTVIEFFANHSVWSIIAQKKELAKKTASSVGEHTVTPTVCVVCNDTARNRREVVNGCSSRQSRNVACTVECACHPFFPSKHDSSIQYGQLGQCGVRSGSRPREV